MDISVGSDKASKIVASLLKDLPIEAIDGLSTSGLTETISKAPIVQAAPYAARRNRQAAGGPLSVNVFDESFHDANATRRAYSDFGKGIGADRRKAADSDVEIAIDYVSRGYSIFDISSFLGCDQISLMRMLLGPYRAPFVLARKVYADQVAATMRAIGQQVASGELDNKRGKLLFEICGWVAERTGGELFAQRQVMEVDEDAEQRREMARLPGHAAKQVLSQLVKRHFKALDEAQSAPDVSGAATLPASVDRRSSALPAPPSGIAPDEFA